MRKITANLLSHRPGIISRPNYRFFTNPNLWVILAMVIAISIFYQFDFVSLKDKPEYFWLLRSWEYRNHFTGTLIFIPVVYAAIVFGWIGILVSWIVSMVIILPQVIFSANYPVSLLYNITFLTAPVMVMVLAVLILNRIKREKQIYKEREEERRSYMTQVLKAHEFERKRIAEELHDDTIQTLVALANRMQTILDRDNDRLSTGVTGQLELIRDSIFQVSEELRRLSISLRPSILDNIGLIEALRWLVDNLNGNNVEAKLDVKGDVRKFGPDTEVVIFRFVQEALNNVKQHSRAGKVVVTLDFTIRSTVKLSIDDNGRGFIPLKPLSKFTRENKLGLIGMQERAQMINGTCHIYSRPGKGTSILLEFQDEPRKATPDDSSPSYMQSPDAG